MGVFLQGWFFWEKPAKGPTPSQGPKGPKGREGAFARPRDQRPVSLGVLPLASPKGLERALRDSSEP